MIDLTTQNSRIFLGVDGGQSHTEALVADERGNIIGRGLGGPSNHAEIPGGRERLQRAVMESVGEALSRARLPLISETEFAAAHFGMTGGADYKEEIIAAVVQARKLKVGHDAPTALFGATSGKPGIVVIAGTGSVVFGENDAGENARAGGLGFLFADEGSGFWLAAQTIRLAIKEQDGALESDGLEPLVTEFFGVAKIRELTTAFYNGKVSRDEIARLSKAAHQAALAGNETLRKQIRFGVSVLIDNVRAVSRRLSFAEKFPVAGVGGMFRAELFRKYFEENLAAEMPLAEFVEPRFSPPIGALLLAYRAAGVEITETLLANLENSQQG